MKTAFQLIEEHGLTLHGDIEHFAELVRAEALAKPDFWEGYVPEPVKPRGEATLAQQEPVAYLCEPDENGLYGLPLTEKTCTKCFPVYRHPQRTWVGLTDEERDAMINVTDLSGTYYYDDLYAVILAAEGKLAEKNT